LIHTLAEPEIEAMLISILQAIQLTWSDNALDETAFALLRYSASCASFQKSYSVAQNATSYTDTDSALTAGTTYCYRVFAIRGVENSPSSNTATVTPNVPAVVSSASANNSMFPGDIWVSWEHSGTNVQGWRVHRENGAGDQVYDFEDFTPSRRSWLDIFGLTGGELYRYEIRAFNAWGEGPTWALYAIAQ